MFGGTEMKKVKSRSKGDPALRGFLGISQDVKVGCQGIRV